MTYADVVLTHRLLRRSFTFFKSIDCPVGVFCFIGYVLFLTYYVRHGVKNYSSKPELDMVRTDPASTASLNHIFLMQYQVSFREICQDGARHNASAGELMQLPDEIAALMPCGQGSNPPTPHQLLRKRSSMSDAIMRSNSGLHGAMTSFQ